MQMNEIMQIWRNNLKENLQTNLSTNIQIPVRTKGKIITEGKRKDIFNDYEYITVILGIEVPLTEGNRYFLSSSTKKKILQNILYLY